MAQPGYIYAMVNASLPGLVKIGRSSRHPEIRALELSGTSVPTGFDVVWFRAVRDAHAAERAAHEKLSYCRESKKREFFRIEIRAAIMQLDRIAQIYEAESPLGQVALELGQLTKSLGSVAVAIIETASALVVGLALGVAAVTHRMARVSAALGRRYWNALPSVLGDPAKALLTLSTFVFLVAMAVLLSDLLSGSF